MPIVGMNDYGMLASVMDLGRTPYFCLPNLEMEAFNPEEAVFFCMAGQRVSSTGMFQILAWILDNAVVGGYIDNVDAACDFLMTNGVTMAPGEINVDFSIIRLEHDCYTLESKDDRSIKIGNYSTLEDLSEALYHLLYKMSDCFGGGMTVSFTFRGEDAEELSDLLEERHRSVFFDLKSNF